MSTRTQLAWYALSLIGRGSLFGPPGFVYELDLHTKERLTTHFHMKSGSSLLPSLRRPGSAAWFSECHGRHPLHWCSVCTGNMFRAEE